jgi:hypothetical protein
VPQFIGKATLCLGITKSWLAVATELIKTPRALEALREEEEH